MKILNLQTVVNNYELVEISSFPLTLKPFLLWFPSQPRTIGPWRP